MARTKPIPRIDEITLAGLITDIRRALNNGGWHPFERITSRVDDGLLNIHLPTADHPAIMQAVIDQLVSVGKMETKGGGSYRWMPVRAAG